MDIAEIRFHIVGLCGSDSFAWYNLMLVSRGWDATVCAHSRDLVEAMRWGNPYALTRSDSLELFRFARTERNRRLYDAILRRRCARKSICDQLAQCAHLEAIGTYEISWIFSAPFKELAFRMRCNHPRDCTFLLRGLKDDELMWFARLSDKLGSDENWDLLCAQEMFTRAIPDWERYSRVGRIPLRCNRWHSAFLGEFLRKYGGGIYLWNSLCAECVQCILIYDDALREAVS